MYGPRFAVCQITQLVISVRARFTDGGDRKRPALSARYIMIEPDSNTDSGGPPSAGSKSTMTGTLLLGPISRNEGSNCSPLATLIGLTRYDKPVSSSRSRIL